MVREGDPEKPLVIPSKPLWLNSSVAGAPPQVPFALTLGCSDARAPIERIFDQPSNALFVVRVAGNVLGTECLGSIDYAVQQLKASLRLLVVLGHTGCGAVTAAVDSYLSPSDYPEVEATVLVLKHRLRLVEVPVQMREREHGSSSITVVRSVYYAIKVTLALFVAMGRRYAVPSEGTQT